MRQDNIIPLCLSITSIGLLGIGCYYGYYKLQKQNNKLSNQLNLLTNIVSNTEKLLVTKVSNMEKALDQIGLLTTTMSNMQNIPKKVKTVITPSQDNTLLYGVFAALGAAITFIIAF